MVAYNYLESKKEAHNSRSVNVVELMQKAKFKEKKERRKSVVVASAAVTAIALIGLAFTL